MATNPAASGMNNSHKTPPLAGMLHTRTLAEGPAVTVSPAGAGATYICELAALQPGNDPRPANAGIALINIRGWTHAVQPPFASDVGADCAAYRCPLTIWSPLRSPAGSEPAGPLPRAPPPPRRREKPAGGVPQFAKAWVAARRVTSTCMPGRDNRNVNRVMNMEVVMNLKGGDTPQGRGSRRCRSARSR